MCRKALSRLSIFYQISKAACRTRSVRDFYDALAPIYDEAFTDHLVHIDTIVNLLDGRYPSREDYLILDLACGTGLLSQRLTQYGFEVIGLDFSTRSLEVLRQKDNYIPAICGSAERLPFADRSLTAVVCLGAWRHFDRPEAVLNEICRVLVPNGNLIIGYFPPKPGAFLTLPSGAFGRTLGRLYAGIIGRLGYVDRIDREHEEMTMKNLESHFDEVRIIPSGVHSHLLYAHALRDSLS